MLNKFKKMSDDDLIDLTNLPDSAETDGGDPIHGPPLDTPPLYNSSDDETIINNGTENAPPGPTPTRQQSDRSGPSADFWMALHRLLNMTFEKVGF
jgi:hypothetical protein